MFKRKPCESNGFTLIEALLAMFLLSIAVFGIFSLLPALMGYNEFAETITTATTLAQDKVETLKGMDPSSLTNGTTTEMGLDENGTVVVGGVYNRSTEIEDGDIPNVKIITTVVSWNWKGNTKDVTLKTMIKN